MLQHTSIIKTASEIFGLNGPLNRRDESARSFADLLEVANQPRSANEMPQKLNRAPLEETVESVVAGVPLHPADEPLDDLMRDGPWVCCPCSAVDSKVWKSPRQPKAKPRPPSKRNSRPPDSKR
jgi:hypothetical protein